MKKIDQSEQLIHWIRQQMSTLEVSLSPRNIIVSSCYDIALEHHLAIVELIKKELYGSAFALGRCIFESFVRGVWFQYCAKDEHIKKYKSGTFEYSIAQFIKEVEKLEGYQDKVLSKTKKTDWNTLNQYMHSGYLQISRRYSDDHIKPNYSETEITEVLNFVNFYALLAAMEMALLAGQEDLEPYLNKVLEYQGSAQTS